ncbi:NUDIX hydrolase [Corynebacterium lowii]|uniref:Putative mutator protein MutT4 n=1 Tax=Corynebacterium lowii TaxID=1544413 RepID=A0A0Q0YJN4_9CORY|nr:NUDIX hydrolase [Corynebacterium lowii]KQB87020.1 putative mutator protein MutT4 [Corynebacterium lowii]MDP9852399.1 8-oxo-dGTP pyrophosphatase MutT (NUDIX family) [Corynebacterium lowii]
MKERDERASQAGGSGTPGGSGASGTSGNQSGHRRKRRRRGGRGRNGQGNHNQSRNNQASDNGNAPSHAESTGEENPQSSGHTGNRRKRRRQGNRNQGSNGGSRNTQRSGQRRGNKNCASKRRSSARGGRGGHRGYSSSRRGPAPSHFDTRRETSAGGLVVSGLAESVRPDGSVDLSRLYVALIGRLDRRGRLLWSMPKGHVEPGEDHRSTAQREVWEETGISGEVFAELGVIDYWFVSEGVRIHKTVHHHLLRYVDGYLNDEDPEVTEVSWIPVHQLIEHLAYADERKLARVAHDILPDLARAEHQAGRHTPR